MKSKIPHRLSSSGNVGPRGTATSEGPGQAGQKERSCPESPCGPEPSFPAGVKMGGGAVPAAPRKPSAAPG